MKLIKVGVIWANTFRNRGKEVVTESIKKHYQIRGNQMDPESKRKKKSLRGIIILGITTQKKMGEEGKL
jgi:hypothetical protein